MGFEGANPLTLILIFFGIINYTKRISLFHPDMNINNGKKIIIIYL